MFARIERLEYFERLRGTWQIAAVIGLRGPVARREHVQERSIPRGPGYTQHKRALPVTISCIHYIGVFKQISQLACGKPSSG
jgi:hypothetical protein